MSEALPEGMRELAAAQVERLATVVARLSDSDLVAPARISGPGGLMRESSQFLIHVGVSGRPFGTSLHGR